MKLPGINIQYPWSQLILNGEKVIETRHYSLPIKYLRSDLLIIETPGRNKSFKARIVGIIQFSEVFKYRSKKAFDMDLGKHRVADDSIFYWSNNRENKWGWVISKVVKFDKPILAPKRKGIRWTSEITL